MDFFQILVVRYPRLYARIPYQFIVQSSTKYHGTYTFVLCDIDENVPDLQ